MTEIMLLGLPQTKEKTLALSAYPLIAEFLEERRVSSIALGPGLSWHPETMKLVRQLVRHTRVPVVLDADGLNAFKESNEQLRRHAGPLVLTPHRNEFQRVFGKKLPENKAERCVLAKKLARFYDVVLVLKSDETLVASGERIYWNKTGNPGMAKGGSGDVLTGIIASFISQGLATFEAGAWAVYFHGLAGDIAVKKKGQLSLLATDVIERLPQAFLGTKKISLV